MDIIGLFSNPLILFAIFTPILVLVGILLGAYLVQPRRNRVIQISPESGRGIDFEVKEEDAMNLRCDPVGPTPPQRFIKRQPALNIITKGFLKLKNYALWLGRVGTAYTYTIKSKPVKLSLKDTIMNIFGKEKYDMIPEKQKKQIEEGQVGVTVEFPDVSLTPDKMPSLSSDDLRRGDIDHFIDALAKGVAKAAKLGSAISAKDIFIVGTGIAIGIVVAIVFGWGTPT